MSWTVVMSMGGSSSELSSPLEPGDTGTTSSRQSHLRTSTCTTCINTRMHTHSSLYKEHLHVQQLVKLVYGLTVLSHQAELQRVLVLQRGLQVHRDVWLRLLFQPIHWTCGRDGIGQSGAPHPCTGHYGTTVFPNSLPAPFWEPFLFFIAFCRISFMETFRLSTGINEKP